MTTSNQFQNNHAHVFVLFFIGAAAVYFCFTKDPFVKSEKPIVQS
jgi:hypothetical protein